MKSNLIMRRLNQTISLGELGWAYMLGLNLAVAGGLCQSYKLGKAYLKYDRPWGNEWWPGCGAYFVDIKERMWYDDEHVFTPGNVKAAQHHYLPGPYCVECGRVQSDWIHVI